MATQNPFYRQPSTSEKAVFFQRFLGVMGTGGLISTSCRD